MHWEGATPMSDPPCPPFNNYENYAPLRILLI